MALAAFTYLGLERLGRRGLVPLACRAIAWAAIGALLVNVSCPGRVTPTRPLVLLDGSLSLASAGGKAMQARAVAESLGEVSYFGDDRGPRDTLFDRGQSRLGPALGAAGAAERTLYVVTDGEIEDRPELPRDVLARAGVHVLPRDSVPDLALSAVVGPTRITSGDTLRLDVEVMALRGFSADSVRLVVTGAGRPLARRTLPLGGSKVARGRIAVPTPGIPPGDRMLQVAIDGAGDAEPRDDARLHLVTVVRTPGIVMLASPPDWDSRFLYRALRGVSDLPTRGYAMLEAGRWRSMEDLRPVSVEDVRQAAKGADLLVLKGADNQLAVGSRARGVLRWPSGEGPVQQLAGDWYLFAAGESPLGSALAGPALDSFPPASSVVVLQPAAGDWVGLQAREGRRGAPRPVIVGRAAGPGGRREIVVAADGLWRWAFRGGASEQTYRSLVGASVNWLLGGADTSRGTVAPVRPVVANGRPLTFRWIGAGAAQPTAITLQGPAGVVRDTLRFDGAGQAAIRLPVGTYTFATPGGSSGLVAVEEYSEEWLARPAVLTDQPAQPVRSSGRRSARDQLALVGLAILALTGEWLARRRLGLR